MYTCELMQQLTRINLCMDDIGFQTISSSKDAPITTFLNPIVDNARTIVVSSDNPLTPTDISYVKVVACKEHLSTTPSTAGTTPSKNEYIILFIRFSCMSPTTTISPSSTHFV